MFNLLGGLVLRNPITAALVLACALLAAGGAYQYVRAEWLEVKVSKAEAATEERRLQLVACHVANDELSASVGRLSAGVDQWKGEAEKRSQAAATALEAAKAREAESVARVKRLAIAPAASCSEAVGRVREVMGL